MEGSLIHFFIWCIRERTKQMVREQSKFSNTLQHTHILI